MTDITSDILALQIEALYKAAPASLLSIVGALIALFVYWTPASGATLVAWVGMVSAVAVIHLASGIVRRKHTALTPRFWSRFVGTVYLASGTSWGVGSAFMVLNGSGQQAIVACCLLMGSVTVSFPAAVYVPAYNLFQVPALLLIAVGLAMSSLQYGLVLAAAAVMLCAVMAIIARGVGAQLALALKLSEENRLLAERLEAVNRDLLVQSNTDPLTGLANRRRLMSVLRSTEAPFALLVVDVDHFKSYNDSFGHDAGDSCLRLIAGTLQAAVDPADDLVARQGGEEFVVVLARRTREEAEARAELIRACIAALFDAEFAILRRRVTISIGLAWGGGEEAASLVETMAAADQAVYAAKRNGRNCVCIADTPERGTQVA